MLDSVPYRALQRAYLHYFLLFLHKKGAIYSRDRSTQGFLFGVQPILCFIFSYPDHPVRMCAVGFGLDLG